LPDAAGPDSFSLLPVLEGRQDAGKPVRGPIVMQSGSSGAMTIRSGDWKLIDQPGSGGFSKSPKLQAGDPPGQLYNLREDPTERNNLFQKQPERVAELTRLMKQIVNAPASRPH
jgi:arylsulfatase A-like enzyme